MAWLRPCLKSVSQWLTGLLGKAAAVASRGALGRSSRLLSRGRRGAGAERRMRSMRRRARRSRAAGQTAQGVSQPVLAQGGVARIPAQTQVGDGGRMGRRELY